MPSLFVDTWVADEGLASVFLVLKDGLNGDLRFDATVSLWACNLDSEDDPGEAVRVSLQTETSINRSWIIVDENGNSPYGGLEYDEQVFENRVTRDEVKIEEIDDRMVQLVSTKLRVLVSIKDEFRVEVQKTDCTILQSDMEHDAYVLDGETNTLRHTLTFDAVNENLFGFGESSGPLRKNGRRIRVDARDAMGYSAISSDPLYKHWPYGLSIRKVDGGDACAVGLLYDTMRRATFDLGKQLFVIATNMLTDYDII